MATLRQPSPLDASPSPPPQVLSKRDVRRHRILERLQAMMHSFADNQPQHYRAQLQAVQVDMTLILRADPYENGPLEDGGEEVREMVESMMGAAVVGDEGAHRDYLAMAGTRYSEFAREVNDCLERRDAGLTALHVHYHSSIAELERLTQQKLHQAEEEHKALASTIRQRLQISLTKKRGQLLRDKEQLDIADSNALLLHPNHFSINNPASPGAAAGQNRKTRHLRHRATSPGNEVGESGKRKRKAAHALDDDGNESPAPAFRAFPPPDALGGGRSPFKDAREKHAYAQYEAPAYSLERLFTDKELAMATATAQQATHRHFHQPRQPHQMSQPDQASLTNGTGTGSGTAAPSIDGAAALLLDVPTALVSDLDDPTAAHPTTEPSTNTATPPPAPLAAVEMERTTSHALTRGTLRANPLAALSDLASTAAALGPLARSAENPFAPIAPAFHAVLRPEKAGAPAPPAVSLADVEGDWGMMMRGATPPQNSDVASGMEDVSNGLEDPGVATAPTSTAAGESSGLTASDFRRHLLDQALTVPSLSHPFRLPLLETGPAVVSRGVERPSWTGFAPPIVYEAQRVKMGVVNAGPVAGTVVGGGAGAGGSGSGGGVLGGEAMSRGSSYAGVEGVEGGLVGGGGSADVPVAVPVVGSSKRGRGRLV